MVRTKLTARRSYEKMRQLPAWIVNREYGKKKKTYLLKIKQTLPAQKTVNITKNGEIVKTINVSRKKKFFFSITASFFNS